MTGQPIDSGADAARSRPADGRVAVITINWNGWRNTLDCLAALRASIGADWHLYIVDNGSTDGSVSQLRDLGSDVTLIEAGINGGWTGGNNLGLRRAMAEGHTHFFVLNNDATVEPDTIRSLLDIAHTQEAGGPPPLLGPVHRGAHGPEYDFVSATADGRTGIPRWMSEAEVSHIGERPLIGTTYISGAAIFVQRRHIEAIGFLDDRFYLNFDDTDWCARAEKAGFPLWMVRDAAINHVGSASIGGRRSPLQVYFLTRNQLLFAEKHCSPRQRMWLLRRVIGQGRALAGGGPSTVWVRRLLTSRSTVIRAFRRGLADYALRRFGDCPAEIRLWNAEPGA